MLLVFTDNLLVTYVPIQFFSSSKSKFVPQKVLNSNAVVTQILGPYLILISSYKKRPFQNEKKFVSLIKNFNQRNEFFFGKIT